MQLSDITDRFSEYLPRLLGALPLAIAIIVGAFLLNLVLGRALLLLARRTHLTEGDVLPVQHVLRWVIRIVALILILSVFVVFRSVGSGPCFQRSWGWSRSASSRSGV